MWDLNIIPFSSGLLLSSYQYSDDYILSKKRAVVEAEKRAEEALGFALFEHARAEKESLKTEAQRKKADILRKKAEFERGQKEIERSQKEFERGQKEYERLQKEIYANKLRELGIDPDSLSR